MIFVTVIRDENGTPITGITPTIRIYDLDDNSLVVTDANMVEVALSGMYKYEYTAYDNKKDYAIRADAGSSYDDLYRYSFGVNDFVSVEEMSVELDDDDGSLG